MKNNCLLKGTVAWDFYGVLFWLEWIYLGSNRNRFWFFSFKEIPLILDCQFKYWCVSNQTFSEILRISEKGWQMSPRFPNFPFFWVSGPPRKAAKGVNTSQRSENDWQLISRFSDNVLPQHKRVSIQWWTTDSVVNPSRRFYESPRRFGIKRTKLKIAAKNRRSIITILKVEAVHIQT